MAAELDLARGLGPESPGAPSKQEMQQGQDYDEEDEEDALSPLNPVKTIRMKRPRNQRKETTAANRLAGGRSTRDWDVGGNSAKNLSALEELVAGASRDMNAAEASMRLQAMLSAGDTSQDQLKLRKSFGDEVNEPQPRDRLKKVESVIPILTFPSHRYDSDSDSDSDSSISS